MGEDLKNAVIEPCDKKDIMIVDDDDIVRRAFLSVLSHSLPGINIDVAINGVEAVELFRKVHHSVILLDLYLPVMNGIDAYRQIDKVCKDTCWELPSVIFCSGFYPPDMLQDIVDQNPDHLILYKPVSNDVLVSEISARLGLSQS